MRSQRLKSLFRGRLCSLFRGQADEGGGEEKPAKETESIVRGRRKTRKV